MDYQSNEDARRADATIDTPDALGRDFFTISDLSNEFDVTARALRFYEDQGLIAPQRQGLSRVRLCEPLFGAAFFVDGPQGLEAKRKRMLEAAT